METIQLEIPKQIVLSLKIPPAQAQQRLREEFAAYLYAEGFLSFGKARELARLSKWEFAEVLGRKQIPRHYTAADLQEDLRFAHGKILNGA